MKKVMLSALLAGMFMIGSVYAQTTPATGKPATSQSSTSGAKSGKVAKGNKKGKKGASGKAATSTKPAAKPADQK